MNVFDYSHIPYWFSINQAIRIIRVSFLNIKKYFEPIAILVFNEKYKLLGIVTIKDILQSLEPNIFEKSAKAQITEGDEKAVAIEWETLFNKNSKETGEKSVSEIMVPVTKFTEPDDPVTKAAYLMLHNDPILLPVLENKRKLVGLEVFEEISDTILSE